MSNQVEQSPPERCDILVSSVVPFESAREPVFGDHCWVGFGSCEETRRGTAVRWAVDLVRWFVTSECSQEAHGADYR